MRKFRVKEVWKTDLSVKNVQLTARSLSQIVRHATLSQVGDYMLSRLSKESPAAKLIASMNVWAKNQVISVSTDSAWLFVVDSSENVSALPSFGPTSTIKHSDDERNERFAEARKHTWKTRQNEIEAQRS